MKDPEDFKYVPPGIAIPVRFIKTPGRGFEIPAVLYPDDGTTIERTEAFVKEIGALTPEDLAGMSPDTGTSELVRYHLATLYDTPLPAHDALVTVWRFKYLPTATD